MKTCYFCGGEVLSDLVVHSLDYNHDNWDPLNKVDAHRSCHSGYHASIRERKPWTRSVRRVRIEEAIFHKIQEAIGDGVCSSFQGFVLISIEKLISECV